MKIKLVSIPVLNQEEALQIYTGKLGFQKKHDIPVGDGNRWLTVVAKEDPEGPELLLEPSPLHFEPAKTFQDALYEAGIPITQFYVDDLEKEFEQLKDKGIDFTMDPTNVGSAIIAIFDDTCGNKVQIVQEL